jgi:hypothetical protein
MSKVQLAKVNKRVVPTGTLDWTNQWDITLLEEVDGVLVEGKRIRVNLENKTSSSDYNRGDIINLRGFRSWGWAPDMFKAKSTLSRKWN